MQASLIITLAESEISAAITVRIAKSTRGTMPKMLYMITACG